MVKSIIVLALTIAMTSMIGCAENIQGYKNPPYEGKYEGEYVEFGPTFHRFQVKIPKGWGIQEIPEGVQSFALDRNDCVAIMCNANPYRLSTLQWAQSYAKGLKTPQIRHREDEWYDVQGLTKDNQHMLVSLYANQREVLTIMQPGGPSPIRQEIIRSVKY